MTKISNRKLQHISTNIAHLGLLQKGIVVVGKGDDGKPETVVDLSARIHLNARASYALRRNADKIDFALGSFYEARKERIKLHSEDGKVDLSSDKNADGSANLAQQNCLKDINELLDEEADIDFHMLNEAELELDKNNIPMDILSALKPFIVQNEDEVKVAVLPKQ